jgi:hypothetical protein
MWVVNVFICEAPGLGVTDLSFVIGVGSQRFSGNLMIASQHG